MTWLLLLMGCQEPFGTHKQHLEGFRLLTVAFDPPPPTDVQTSIGLHAVTLVDGHLWSDKVVQYRCGWLGQRGAADWPLEQLVPPVWEQTSEGPSGSLRLPGTDGLLIASLPDGTERRALFTVARTPVLHEVKLQTEPVAMVGQHLVVDDISETTVGLDHSWMSTSGTWVQQSETQARWYPGQVVFDDEGLEVVGLDDSLPEGHTSTLVGLTHLLASGGSVGIVDVHVGTLPEPGAWVDGRWLPGAIEGWQVALLTARDDAPLGLVATDVRAVDEAEAQRTLQSLCSGSDMGPFDPKWLVTGQCLRSELSDRTVSFFGTGAP
jgi:hypothetical protein